MRVRANAVPTIVAGLAAAAVLLGAGSAAAGSTPIGALPPGPHSTIVTDRGSLVAVPLPGKQRAGLVWRLARPVRASVLR